MRRMRTRTGAISWLAGALLVTAFVAGCERREAPAVPPTSPIAPPAPPLPTPPLVIDAAADAVDASADAGDGGMGVGRRPGKKPAREPAAGGGGGALTVKGNLPKPDADRVVRAASAKMRACYDKEKAANPGLAGKVVFRLTVDDRGRVAVGEVVTSTLGGGDAEMCMVRATRDLKFPAAEGESTVEFQMSFAR
jgi:hypothetical protein